MKWNKRNGRHEMSRERGGAATDEWNGMRGMPTKQNIFPTFTLLFQLHQKNILQTFFKKRKK